MGNMGKGCALFGGGLLVLLLLIGGCGVSKYNHMVAGQEGVEGSWSEIQNQYTRRFDLVPQLVETVKGAANFEKSTITAVTEARASVGKLQVPDTIPDDPAALEAYMAAQSKLGSSLGRLLLVAENYPNLKASQNFLGLQDQLEGTENRIAVARRDYIDTVKAFNTSIRKFPNNLIASSFGFEKVPQLEFDSGVQDVPSVDFNFDD